MLLEPMTGGESQVKPAVLMSRTCQCSQWVARVIFASTNALNSCHVWRKKVKQGRSIHGGVTYISNGQHYQQNGEGAFAGEISRGVHDIRLPERTFLVEETGLIPVLDQLNNS